MIYFGVSQMGAVNFWHRTARDTYWQWQRIPRKGFIYSEDDFLGNDGGRAIGSQCRPVIRYQLRIASKKVKILENFAYIIRVRLHIIKSV